jgi:hypothetical protein
MVGHRAMGNSLMGTGNIKEGRAHYDRALALYTPAQHCPLTTRFGQDVGVTIVSFRSWALWMLGYPEAALADAEQALKNAREIGQSATLMYALVATSWTHILRGNYTAANAQLDEVVLLADEKSALYWKAHGTLHQGCVFALTGKASNAVQMITSGAPTPDHRPSTIDHRERLSGRGEKNRAAPSAIFFQNPKAS